MRKRTEILRSTFLVTTLEQKLYQISEMKHGG